MIQRGRLERKLDAIYSGRFEVRIDEKSRLAIPICFRKVAMGLTGQTAVFLSRAQRNKHPYLAVYDVEMFLQRNESDERLANGESAFVKWDKQGRIHLPPYLRDYADINAEAVVFGAPALTHFEIWTRDYAEHYGQRPRDHSA